MVFPSLNKQSASIRLPFIQLDEPPSCSSVRLRVLVIPSAGV